MYSAGLGKFPPHLTDNMGDSFAMSVSMTKE
jgi:hypothetical protein